VGSSKSGNGSGLVGLTVGGGGRVGTVTVAVAVGNESVTAAILAFEADGPSQGWTGKVATYLSASAKKRSGEECGTAAGAFERARARGGEGKRRGSAWCRVGVGEERRGRGRGVALPEPAWHGRGGSEPLGQRRAVHIAWAQRLTSGA
jgi:hypothetical protein